MGSEREQEQPSEYWQTFGRSGKRAGTQKQHTPPGECLQGRFGFQFGSLGFPAALEGAAIGTRHSAFGRREKQSTPRDVSGAPNVYWPNADSQVLKAALVFHLSC